MFSFSAWSAWDFVILAIVLIPKWFHVFSYQATPPEYVSRSKRLHVIDFVFRVLFATTFFALRTDTGWRHGVWMDLGFLCSVGLVAGGFFKWLAVQPFPKLREALSEERRYLDELYAIILVAKVVPSALLFVIAHVTFGNEKSEYLRQSPPLVSNDGVTMRMTTVSLLEKTKHESGVYEYVFSAYLPKLTLFRYLAREDEPVLDPKVNWQSQVVVHYKPSGTPLGVNEVSRVEQFELPEHAP